MSQSCISSNVRKRQIDRLAQILAKEYIRQGQYSVIDRLATAIDEKQVLLAVYELLRGLRDKLDDDAKRVIDSIARDVQENVQMCREEILKLAKDVAIVALAVARSEEKGE